LPQAGRSVVVRAAGVGPDKEVEGLPRLRVAGERDRRGARVVGDAAEDRLLEAGVGLAEQPEVAVDDVVGRRRGDGTPRQGDIGRALDVERDVEEGERGKAAADEDGHGRIARRVEQDRLQDVVAGRVDLVNGGSAAVRAEQQQTVGGDVAHVDGPIRCAVLAHEVVAER
jgi:hypothetical protein